MDLDYLDEMARGINKQITYGSADAEYIGKPVMDEVFLQVASLNKNAEALIKTKLVGIYNYPNVMAAIAIGRHFDIGIDEIRAAIEAYDPDNSRSQWLKVGSNSVILDAYNANPASMKAAITNFVSAELPEKMLWLGGMKEMGADERKEHMELVELVQQSQWKDVILVGKEFEGLAGQYKHFNTSGEAAEYVSAQKPANASILIKGSRGSKMELLLDALKA